MDWAILATARASILSGATSGCSPKLSKSKYQKGDFSAISTTIWEGCGNKQNTFVPELQQQQQLVIGW